MDPCVGVCQWLGWGCGLWGLHAQMPEARDPGTATGWTELSKLSYCRDANICVFFPLTETAGEGNRLRPLLFVLMSTECLICVL